MNWRKLLCKKRIRELEIESSSATFWQDHMNASHKMKEMSALQKDVDEADLLQLMVDEGQWDEVEEALGKMEMLLMLILLITTKRG